MKTQNRLKVGNVNKYGIRVPVIRKLAKDIGKNHELANQLWAHGFLESRLLAIFIEDYNLITEDQMDSWVNDFDSWDIVDQACINLFVNMPLAIAKIPVWVKAEEEFVKRTAFSLIAVIAVHDKKSEDSYFEEFFPILIEGADDNRNFVKKAVNWAIRSIGKKNKSLNKKAIELSYELLEMDSKSAKWIAKNAIKELESEKVQNKLNKI
ncbi:MAG: DNA alkylation repair protein [archaeon]|nr:DNA alkylation repair protein [archaeon]